MIPLQTVTGTPIPDPVNTVGTPVPVPTLPVRATGR